MRGCTIPERYRKAEVHVIEQLVPEPAFLPQLGEYLHAHRDKLQPDQGCFVLADVDLGCEELAVLRQRIDEVAGRPVVDLCAVLHHHGGQTPWTRASSGTLIEYTIHTDPRMFTGGAREFLDGTRIEPVANQLAIYAATQTHRVRRVECWSAEILHGRWSIAGYLQHETAPVPAAQS